jgi:hypothetical protein
MRVPHRLREFISLTTNLLDELGIEWTLDTKHKHPRLLYRVNGKGFIQVVAGSSSDVRAAMNMRGDVLRAIKREQAGGCG